jgi:hypothetical protein
MSNGISELVTLVKPAKQQSFIFLQLFCSYPHCFIKFTSTLCSCQRLADIGILSRLNVHSLHIQNGICCTRKKFPDRISTPPLLAFHACQLQKYVEDLESIKECVLKTCFTSVKKFEAIFENRIKDYDFHPGSLVLVQNSRIGKELSQKMKPRHMEPMVVLRWMTSGSYMLAELDDMVSNLRFTTFHLVPYHTRTNFTISEYFTEYDEMNWTQLQKKLIKSWTTKNPDNPDPLNPTRTNPQVSAYHPQHTPIINTTSYVSILSRVLASALICFILGFDQRICIVSKCLFSSRCKDDRWCGSIGNAANLS